MNVDEVTLRRIMREETQQIVRDEINRAIDDKSGSLRRVVHEELKSELDNRFTSFEKKVDAKLDARFANFESKLNIDLAKYFGDTHRYFDWRFDKFEKKFDKKFNGLQNSVDGIVKRLSDDDIERAAMGAQLGRHERRIGELARHTGAKLSPP